MSDQDRARALEALLDMPPDWDSESEIEWMMAIIADAEARGRAEVRHEAADMVRDTLSDALAAPVATAGWQDMSSAPKDGTEIVVWESGSMGAMRAYYDKDDGWRSIDSHSMQPTFWIPLPAPPEARQDQ